MKNTTETSALSLLANDAGYDPLEDRLRENIRSTIEAVFEEELAQFLGRCRYGREDALRQGYRRCSTYPGSAPPGLGKFREGQADHYILPAVPCPVIHACGDLDDCKSRWQNRQTAMLARTRPGPAGARGTPARPRRLWTINTRQAASQASRPCCGPDGRTRTLQSRPHVRQIHRGPPAKAQASSQARRACPTGSWHAEPGRQNCRGTHMAAADETQGPHASTRSAGRDRLGSRSE